MTYNYFWQNLNQNQMNTQVPNPSDRLITISEIAAKFEHDYTGGTDPWDYTHSAAEVLRYMFVVEHGKRHYPQPAHLVELGCGMGLFTQFLAGWPQKITGIDISTTAIETGKQRLARLEMKGSEVELLAGSATDALVPPHSADVITLMDVLESVADSPHIKEAIIANTKQLIKPGGLILFTDYTHPSRFPELLMRYQNWGFQIVEHHYLNDRLWHSMRANFKAVRNLFPFKQLLGSLTVGRVLARISARRGPKGSKHMLVVARYEVQ